jgi:predicted transcriptional regulator
MPRVVNPDRVPTEKSPNGLSISVRFPPDTFHRIRELAQADERSMNWMVLHLVDEGFAAIDRREKARKAKSAA